MIDVKKIAKILPKKGIIKMLSPVLEVGILSVSRGLLGKPKIEFNAYASESNYKTYVGNPVNFIEIFFGELSEKAPEMFAMMLGAIPDNNEGLGKTDYMKKSLANIIADGVKKGLRYCYIDTVNNKCFFQFKEGKILKTRELKIEDLINTYING